MTDGSRFDDRVVRVVAAIALLGLVARLLLLGDRVAHFDEGRVAWWAHNFAQTGQFHYRYIIHGPLIQHVDRALFGLLGATDFTARLPVAVVGGLLPLSALWFRHRLSETEVGALAVLLAANPILLYYSRFMRSTLLVAAFCFVAFAAFVRWYDGLGVRYFHIGLVALGLGFAAKENAIVYVLCWLGAGVLVLHHKVYRHDGAESGGAWLASAARSTWRRIAGPNGGRFRFSLAHLVGGVGLLGLVVLFFYAPRQGVTGAGALAITPDHPNYQQVVDTCRQTGLWSSLAGGDLGSLFRCTELTIQRGLGYWFGGSSETTITTYGERLGKFLSTSASYAGPLFALAIAGFLIEQYVTDEPRHLVLGVAYWGFASVVGYPLGTDIWAGWIIVNALVPLALPAAVGLGYILDAGRNALATDDRVSVGLVAVLLLLIGGVMLSTGVSAVYLNPTSPDNELVQFAQPEQDMRPAVATTLDRAATTDGPDVLFYGGSDFVDMDEQATRTPACINWFRTLPWAWYLSPAGVDVTCANDSATLPEEMPPVVVAQAECTLDRNLMCREQPAGLEVDSRLRERVPDDYERRGFLHRSTGGSYFDGMVVFYESET